MGIGMSELIVVFIIALLVIGPDKLPQYARKCGEALAVFRKASDEATREIKKNIVEPLEEAQKPLREAMEPVEEIGQAVKGNLKDVQASIEHIGKSSGEHIGKPSAREHSGKTAAPAEDEPAGDKPTQSVTESTKSVAKDEPTEDEPAKDEPTESVTESKVDMTEPVTGESG